jgi:hypothetical protein
LRTARGLGVQREDRVIARALLARCDQMGVRREGGGVHGRVTLGRRRTARARSATAAAKPRRITRTLALGERSGIAGRARASRGVCAHERGAKLGAERGVERMAEAEPSSRLGLDV